MAKQKRKAKGRRPKRRQRAESPASPVDGEEASPDVPPRRPGSKRAKPPAALGSRRIGIGVAIVLALGLVFFGRRAMAPDEPMTVERDARRGPVTPERLVARVHRRLPHDPAAFTQGLLWHDGHLYESTGIRGRSSLRQVDLTTGEVLRKRDLERRYFGEGLALVGDHLFQLTWTSGRALVWRFDDFSYVREHEYEGEGWGLCFDGEHLVMSNGSATLSFRDPTTFEERRRLRVRRDGRPQRDLNELECALGAIWANVWQADEIVRIDPETGHVTGVVDASGLLDDAEAQAADVLNGIAYIPERERFVITGKLWPHLFEVEFVPADE